MLSRHTDHFSPGGMIFAFGNPSQSNTFLFKSKYMMKRIEQNIPQVIMS